MKKLLALILTLCMVLGMLPVGVFAADEAAAETATETTAEETTELLWEYELYGEGVALTKYLGTATDVYAPSKIEVDGTKYAVIKLSDSLFEDNDALNSVTLGDGITEIGARAFYDADNLVCIVTNEQLTTIGAEAFYSCDSFNSIILYDAATSIGTEAFLGCPELTVWCNEGTVGYTYAIENNIPSEILNPDAIPETVVLDGATYYLNNGTAMLMSIEKAERVIIPAYVKNCPVTKVSYGLLSNMYFSSGAYMELYIPDTIIDVPEDFAVNNGVVIHCGKGSAMQAFLDKNYEPYILSDGQPAEIVTDGDYIYNVYSDHVAVREYIGSASIVEVSQIALNLPVSSILPYAFNQLESLTDVVLPETLTSIFSYAFNYCKNLYSINIPRNVTTLTDYTFVSCSALTELNIHDGILKFGTNFLAYSCCVSSMKIPQNVAIIEREAFTSTQIEEINYPINAQVDDNSFANGYIKKVYVNDNTSEININAFRCFGFGANGSQSGNCFPVFYLNSKCKAIDYCKDNGLAYCILDELHFEPYTYVDYGEMVDSSGTGYISYEVMYLVLSDYAVLTKCDVAYYEYVQEAEDSICLVTADYTIPESIDGKPVTKINDFAFEKAYSLRSLNIPDCVTHIGVSAFYDCTGLSSISLSKNIKNISDYAFKGCSSLKNILLHEGILTIGDSAFAYSGIEEIEFPKTLRKIGESAFSNCNLKTLSYPNIEVGAYAFSYCSQLNSLTIEDGVIELPKRVFMGCNELVFVHAPNSLTHIEKDDSYTFSLCSKIIFIVSDIGNEVVKYAKRTGKSYYDKWWYDTNGVQQFEYEQDGIKYWIVDQVFGDYQYSAMVVGYDDTVTGDIVIPDYVTVDGRNYPVLRFGAQSLSYANITSIQLPNSLKVLGDGALQCTKISEIDLPENLDYFGVNMFNATNIEEFTFPTNYDLNFGVLGFTPSLKKVNIPEGVKSIPEWAFAGCNNIEEIMLPQSLEKIASYGIYNISAKFKKLIIPGNVELSYKSVQGISGLEVIILNEGITNIPEAFGELRDLKLMYIPESVESIDYSAFKDCPKAIFCVYENSYSHEYCEKRGLPYFIIRKTENPEINFGTGLTGTVTYTDGSIAAGVNVEIIYDDGVSKETVVTDENGVYEFTYAEVGAYTIRATDAEGNTFTTPVSVKRMNAFDVFTEGDTDLTLKKGYNVSGTVSEGGATVTVTVTDGDANVITSVTADDNGTFTIENLPNGTYVITATTEQGSASTEVTVYNNDVSDITLTIATETVTLWGYVEVEDREFKHHRRNWVQITVYNEEGVAVAQRKSDGEGKYTFSGLPTGEYSIVAETAEMRKDKKHGFDRSHTLIGYAYVSALTAGEYEVDTIVLHEENDHTATISGKVTANGQGNRSEVRLVNVFRHEVAKMTTGSNGKYSFTNVKDGLYYIIATTERDGMGMEVVAVRNGKVHGDTDIRIHKSDKIKDREDRFKNDIPDLEDRDGIHDYRDRIAEEKRFYDGLSEKEKKQLSRDYTERLNKYCEWLASTEYTSGDGVTVEGGGLILSGDELESEDTVSFNIDVTKKDAHNASTDGVHNGDDFIYHKMNDTADGKDIVQYYEITMSKTVGGEEKAITSVYKDTDATGKFRITITIPEEYRGHAQYTMLHEHHGEVVTLADLDDDPDTITVEVDRFSTFALAASDESNIGEVGAETGDANADGYVNVLDMTVTARYIAQGGISGTYDLTDCDTDAVDANADGAIDQLDLNAIAAIIRSNG